MTHPASSAPAGTPSTIRRILLEVGAVYLLAIALVRAADGVDFGPASLRGILPPIIWIYLPFLVLLLGRRSAWDYGLDLGDWRAAIRDAAVTLALMIPPYLVGHFLFQGVLNGHRFQFRVPHDLGSEVVGNLLSVGFPEEVFFRGYLLGRLIDAFGEGKPLWGGRVGAAVLLSALLFNLAHPLAGGRWWQGNVPFGVLLGWLRTRRSSLVAPTLVHGVTNVVFRWAEYCWTG